MDLFSSIETKLPGYDDPDYNGIKSSVCHLAIKWFAYADYSYNMADRANRLKDELVLKQWHDTGLPVSNQQQIEYLKQAIKTIYRHG